MHITAWVVLFSLPYLLRPSFSNAQQPPKAPENETIKFIIYRINDFCLIGFFYLNAFVLFPKLVYKKNYLLYIVSLALSFALLIAQGWLVRSLLIKPEDGFTVQKFAFFNFFIFLSDRLGRGLIHEAVHVARLRDVPVLAELAREVAARRAEREDRAARQEVVERLLLHGVDAEARRASVGGEHHRVVHARTHEAGTPLALVQAAFARAEVALHAAVVEALPPAPGMKRSLDRLRRAVVHRGISPPCSG